MDKFIGLKDFGDGPVAEFRSEHMTTRWQMGAWVSDNTFRANKSAVRERIKNSKHYGLNNTENKKALKAIERAETDNP